MAYSEFFTLLTGCRAELAERALLAQKRKNNAGPSEPKKFKIEQEQRKGEYTAILEEYGLTDPDVLNAWSVDISALPILDVGKIFHYILTKEAFDTYYLSDYKTKKAYQYLESVCVRSIKVQSSADFIFVRGSVAQLNAGGDGYDAKKPANISKILMTSDGDIVVSCCTCTEDLYQCCNHVIAVLFRVERLVREMDSTDSQTSTRKSKEDQDESVKPVKITDLFKKKDLFAQSLLGKIPKPSAEEKRKFMEKICRTAPNSLFAQMFRGAIDAGQNLTMGQQSEQQSTVSVRMKDGKQTIVVVGRGPDGPGEKVASGGQGAQRSSVQASVSLPKAVGAQTSVMNVASGPPSTAGIQAPNIHVQAVTPLQVVGVPVSGFQVAPGSAAGVAGIQVLSGGQMAGLQTVPTGLFMVGGQAVVGAPTLIGGQALVGTQAVAGRQAVIGAQAVGGGKSVAEGEPVVEGQAEVGTGDGESPAAV